MAQGSSAIGPRRMHGERLSVYRFRQARHALIWAGIWALPAVALLMFYGSPKNWSVLAVFVLVVFGGIAAGAILLGCFYALAGAWRRYLETHRVARYFWKQFKALISGLFMLTLGSGVLAFLGMVLFRIQIPFGDERQTVHLGDDAFAHWMVFLFLGFLALGLASSGLQKLRLLSGR